MRYSWSVLAALAVWGLGSSALAQTGLYGSPEMIPLGSGQPLRYSSVGNPAARPVNPPAAPPSRYAATPASFGQVTNGPALVSAQGYPTYVAQAAPEMPPPPAPAAMPTVAPSAASPTPASGAPSVLDQLLQESGGVPTPNDGLAGTCGLEPGCDNGCGDCQACARCPWYASTTGLYLTRDMPNRVWTTYETGNNPNQLMNTEDAWINSQGGLELTLGRRFCCDEWAVEGTVWGLAPMHGYRSLSPGGGQLSTPFDFTGVTFPAPPIGNSPALPVELFDGADAHFVERTNEIYNVELNLLRHPCQCSETLSIDWLAGFRWLHFREHLLFGSCDAGGLWSDPTTCGYLDDRIQNDLLGAQVGLNANWYLGYHLSLFAQPKIGLYNNHIQNDFDAYGGGQHFEADSAGTYPVSAHKNAISFLTEIDLGVSWQFHPQWSASLGYRVLFATNMGLADNQLPHYISGLPELQSINDNGELLLHGAFTSLSYSF